MQQFVECLFCGYKAQTCWGVERHMDEDHQFRFSQIQEKCPPELKEEVEYTRALVVNYLRHLRAVRDPSDQEPLDTWEKNVSPQSELWKDPSFLIPQVHNDALLYIADGGDAVEEDSVESDTSSEDRSSTSESDRDRSAANKSYFEGYSDLGIQREMVIDRIRTEAYKNFIEAAADKIRGKRVMDLGGGSGILSIFCAKVGAVSVLSVDASAGVQGLAAGLAKDNGVSDIIQVLHADLDTHQLYYDNDHCIGIVKSAQKTEPLPNEMRPYQCDVIVSEWMGYGLLFEGMLHTLLAARDQYLVSGGLLIPNWAKIFVSPCALSEELSTLLCSDLNEPEKSYGINLRRLAPAPATILGHVQVAHVPQESLLSAPQELCTLDLATVEGDAMVRITGTFKFDLDSPPTSLCLWFECGLTLHGSASCCAEPPPLSTSPWDPSTHWKQSLCHLQRSDGDPLCLPSAWRGEIKAEITLNQKRKNRYLRIVVDCIVSDQSCTDVCSEVTSVRLYELR